MRKWYQKGIALLLAICLCQSIQSPVAVLADTENEVDSYLDVTVKKEYIYHTFGLTDDRYSSYQWALQNIGKLWYWDLLPSGEIGKKIRATKGIDIGIKETWSYFEEKGSNREIIVAIIDTGVDTKHEDLKGHFWVNELENSNQKDDDDNGLTDDVNGWNFYDNSSMLCNYGSYDAVYQEYEDDHGTHCAGTIAATKNNGIGIAGIVGNANIKLMVIKALGGSEGSDTGVGNTSSIVQAIRYAERMGAQICNLSFGGEGEDPVLRSVIEDSDMLFVCASGNDGKDMDDTPMYPAAYNFSNVISVANMNADGSLAASSNYGVKNVDLGAPGATIMSTLVGDNYGTMTGTSMSAPMVTGACELLYSFHDSMTAKDAKNIVLNTTTSLESLDGKVKTGGMLNVLNMLKATYQPSEQNKALNVSLSTKSVKNSTAKKIKIDVDTKRDLVEVRIAKGNVSLSKFQSGKVGTALTNKKSQMHTVKKSGTYTIYVRDRAGEEQVSTIMVEIKTSLKDKGLVHKSKMSFLS